MEHHVIPIRTYVLIFAALFVLLILTVLVSLIDVGIFNIVLAMTIAVAKAVLIILYFMHVRYSSRLTWIFVAAGFVWLAILIGITVSDYIAHMWLF